MWVSCSGVAEILQTAIHLLNFFYYSTDILFQSYSELGWISQKRTSEHNCPSITRLTDQSTEGNAKHWQHWTSSILHPPTARTPHQLSDQSILYIEPNLTLCFFVPYSRPKFWADLHQIRYAASVCPPDSHGPVSECRERPQASIYAAANEWRAPLGNFWLAGAMDRASQARESGAARVRSNWAP